MKFAVVLIFALFAVAYARPNKDTQIVRLDSEVLPNSFKYDTETSDGTKVGEEGVLQHEGSEHEAIAVKGYYSFVADDGKTYTVHYTADENGFQPVGEHLPVA